MNQDAVRKGMKGRKLHGIWRAGVSQWGWDDEKDDERQG